MNKKVGFLATAALALALAGCGSQTNNQSAMYEDNTPSSQSSTSSDQSTSSVSESSETNESSSIESSTTDEADQAVAAVSVKGNTWSEQESSVKSQVNDDQIQTVRASLTDVSTQQASQSDSTVKKGRLLEDSESTNSTGPEAKAIQKAKDTVLNMDTVPDQTENRVIIAKTNGLSVHALDQYSDAQILEARLVAENLGSDAGYSYRYLTQNYKQDTL
ncbi:MAG: hypothetical protein Q4A67_00130 [Aerococcus sp.]|nr:hypothetical protein [Aerococcus sp.]